MTVELKPFVLNIGDITFLLDQVNHRPLFDADGKLIMNWGGDTAIYATNQGAAGGPALFEPSANPTPEEAAAATAQWGRSFYSVADAAGLRDVSGLSNNLNPDNADWGAVDVPFLTVGTSGELGYGTYMMGDVNNPLYNAGPATATKDYTITGSGNTINIDSVTDYTPRMITQTIMTGGVRFLLEEVTQDVPGQGPLTTNNITYWDSARYNTDEAYKSLLDSHNIDTSKLIEGAAIIDTYQDVLGTYDVGLYAYGQLMAAYGLTEPGQFHIIDIPGLDAQIVFIQEAFDQYKLIQDEGIDPATLNNGDALIDTSITPWGIYAELGVPDRQNPDNGDVFLESQNPGVAPTNGFFAVFGQFFDHGLDFVSKGGNGAKITIPLSPNDPLYGVLGQDGRPTTSITISRATVDSVDENGVPLYINHTSPFIDQSQTYGSNEQITQILREWVLDPNSNDYVAGTRLLDGQKNVEWVDGFGNATTATLPTLNELRAHLAATGRPDITWEDVSNLSIRDDNGNVLYFDANGDAQAYVDVDGVHDMTGALVDATVLENLSTKGSGHALLLDMNPGFGELVSNGNTSSGTISQAALDAVNTAAGVANGEAGFLYFNADGVLSSLASFGPGPLVELTGASALMGYVNFADFSVSSADPVLHAAVGEILMQAVGIHYLAGDGRVNENIALTSIHHIFHMEHDYQVQNLAIALFQQDAANPAVVDPADTAWQNRTIIGDTNTAPVTPVPPQAPEQHSVLHAWQSAVTDTVDNSTNASVALVDGHYEATTGILARDEKNDFYVVASADEVLPEGHSIVKGRDGADIQAAGSYTDAAGYVSWDQERLFQGVKLVVEMEYQHTAIDQFARAVSPDIPEFSAYSTNLDGTISMMFGQAAYRYGHSTLRETIDTLDPNGDMTGRIMSYALERAFLNPELYSEIGASSIVMGMTRQVMNDIDEFVTPALQQGLLGLPMDLAAINLARGRDVGLPTLNEARGILGLSQYTSWNDFAQNMYHKESFVNFIAAYSFDGDVAHAQAVLDAANGVINATYAESSTVSAAAAFLNGGDDGFAKVDLWIGGMAEAHISGGLLGDTFNVIFVDQMQRLMDGDRFYYLYRLAGTQFGDEIINEQFKDIVERNTGTTHLNGNIFGYSDQYYEMSTNVVATERLYEAGTDLAEAPATVAVGDVIVGDGPFFDAKGTQYTALPFHWEGTDRIADAPLWDSANGDRVAAPSVAIGATIVSGVNYVTADGTPVDAAYLQALAGEQHKYGTIMDGTTLGVYTASGNSTAGNGEVVTINGKDYVLDLRPDLAPDALNTDGTPTSGADSNEVVAGTDQDDLLYLGFGDDTGYADRGNDIVYGGSGGDRIYGGAGNDVLYGEDLPDVIDGGEGDDIIYGGDSGSSVGGFDQLIGGAGDDKIYGGIGIDKIYGNGGDDAIYGGDDTDPFIFGGDGSDIVNGGDEQDNIYGNAGDDLLIGGNDKDILFGQEGDDILRPGIPSGAANPGGGNTGNAVFGPDEVVGGTGNAQVNDTGFDIVDLSDNTLGFNLEINLNAQNNPLVILDQNQVLPTMVQMDGIAGTQDGDVILGNADGNWLIGAGGDDHFEADIAPRLAGAQPAVLAERGGNDVIIGGAIRLDALIGKYGTGDINNFVADLYETHYDLIGATHRVAEGASLIGGLLNGAATAGLFALHFTEMLRSAQFKDLVLGNSDNEIGDIGDMPMLDTGNDTASLTGNLEDYSVVAIDINGNQVTDLGNDYASVFGVRLTDNGSVELPDGGGVERQPTDGTDLFIGVESFAFADGTYTMREVIGNAPTLALDYDGGVNTYLDQFERTANDNSDGDTPWTTVWTEMDDGQNNVDNGQIQIDNRFSGAPSNGMDIGYGDGATIYRDVDLEGMDTATISFSFRESGLGTGEYVEVRFYADNTSNDYTVLQTITSSAKSEATLFSQTINGPFAANGRIEIVASNISDTRRSSDFVSIDDMQIAVESPPSNPQYAISRAFTEGDGGITVIPRPLITDVGEMTLTSAKIVLTNAKEGDDLVWTNGTTGNGFSIDRDTSVAGKITLTLSSDTPQSFEAFAARLDNIQFVNTSGNPDETTRIIQSSVNDGRTESAPATTTITVTSVPSPAIAVDDNVVARSGNFDIPEWALTANDYDPEGDAFSITDTFRQDGLNASQPNGDQISVQDTNGRNNTFDYHVTGGDRARVDVNFDTWGSLSGSSRSDIVIDDNGDSDINAGAGDDIIFANGGNDGIVWFANGGRDFVDGGDGTDTFTVNGDDTSEVFKILDVTQAIEQGFLPTNVNTEIVVVRNDEVIAELTDIEELVVNTGVSGFGALAGGASTFVNGDTIEVAGDFTGTSLNYETIHINGTEAHDTVDITGLMSAHRIVFDTLGGDDQVMGNLRAQDIVIRPTSVDGRDMDGLILKGDKSAETITTGEQDDYVMAHGGDDIISAGEGNDIVRGDAGDDIIFGGEGNDQLGGDAGNDVVFGGEGDDTILGWETAPSDDTYFGDDVDGGTGIDTLSLELATTSVTVDLGSDGSNRGTAYSVGTGLDTFYDIENVKTGSGDDVITASNAVNVIDGGEGMDIFRFNSAEAADGDQLSDFEPGDVIDFSMMDADQGVAGDQSFTITSGAFTGAGQLMITQEDRDGSTFTSIKGDVDGDKNADFSLEIRGAHDLTNSDFNL